MPQRRRIYSHRAGVYTATAAVIAVGAAITGGVLSGSFNSPDVNAPSVFLTAPAAGATISGTVTVSATCGDNVGCAGVQFKLNGANLGAEDTSAPFSISWDTTVSGTGTFALSAVARDAAGNTTTATSESVTVNPPAVTDVANVFVSSTGSDSGSNCKRFATPVAPPATASSYCLTFSKAYQLSGVGDTVDVTDAGGAFGQQNLLFGVAKADGLGHCDWSTNNSLSAPTSDYSGCITFKPVSGTTPTLSGGIQLEVPYVRLQGAFSINGLTFGNITVNTSCSNSKGHDDVVDGATLTSSFAFKGGSSHVALINSTVDLSASSGTTVVAYVSHFSWCSGSAGTLIPNWGEVANTTVKNLINTTSTRHTECLHWEGGANMRVVNSKFLNCSGHDIYIEAQFGDITNAYVVNNFFDQTCSHQTQPACSGEGSAMQVGCHGNNVNNATVNFNTVYSDTIGWDAPGYQGCTMTGTLTEYANITNGIQASSCSNYLSYGADLQYNMFDTATGQPSCGSNGTVGTTGLVDPTNYDFHIGAGSSANNLVPTSLTGGYPATDIDGDTRPHDANLDAGADER